MNTIPVIIAPHGDDEIIGCFEILDKFPIILYSDRSDRYDEIIKLNKYKDIHTQDFLICFNIPERLLSKTSFTYYFPDPIYEIHPDHRRWGQLGEQLARDGYDVIFYTTNMNVPYIHECKDAHKKQELLEKVYPSQSELWKYDHKYYLFEGRCKWVF
jgi:hypothetical protein